MVVHNPYRNFDGNSNFPNWRHMFRIRKNAYIGNEGTFWRQIDGKIRTKIILPMYML